MKVLMVTKNEPFKLHVKSNLDVNRELIVTDSFYTAFNYVHLMKISTFICHLNECTVYDALKAIDYMRNLDPNLSILVFCETRPCEEMLDFAEERNVVLCNHSAVPYSKTHFGQAA